MKPTRSTSCCRALAFGALGLLTLDLSTLQAQPLEIYRQPTNFWYAVSPGATIRNTVGARYGTPPYYYQWRFKANPIPWATNAFITLTNVQVIDAGLYDVVVTDAASASVTSDVDELEIDPTFIVVRDSPVVDDKDSSAGSSWADYDDDGDIDLLVGNGFQAPAAERMGLYRNDGPAGFVRLAEGEAGSLPGGLGVYGGGYWADYDNDGLLDCLFPKFSASPQLHRSVGNGVFTKAVSPPLTTTSFGIPTWVDYDNDGWIDAFLWAGHRLFRNLGAGSFTQVTTGSDIFTDQYVGEEGVAWGDYDGDGDLDVICLDFHTWVADNTAYPNHLYRNDGGGMFTRITDNAIALDRTGSLAAAWADYDNDGRLDLFVVAYPWPETCRLFHNDGDGQFTRILMGESNESGQPTWADFDNDGDLDLYIVRGQSVARANLFYRNNGDGTFTQITSGSPANDLGKSISAVWGDYDNDGFLDLFVANGPLSANFLYHNGGREAGNRNHWLSVRLEGRVSNRSAIGAKVRVYAEVQGRMQWQLREVPGTDRGQGDLRAHFGLDQATNVTTLRIEWPSGNVQELTNVTPDQMLTLTEPTLITPARPSASPNGSVTLARTAVSAATYQWQFNGAALAGQTNRILNLTNLVAEQEGRYSVVVSTATSVVTNYVYLHLDTSFTVIKEGPLVTDLGGGALGGVADIDNDGDLDVSVGRALGTSAVYYNNGNGTFASVTNLPYVQAGVTTDGWMDFDNDGRLDPMTLDATRRMRGIHFDNGDGTFSQNEMTGWLLSLADYNRDGLLDVFSTLGVVGLKNVLYRNNGDRTFTIMPASTVGPLADLSSWGGPCWGDLDDDGWPDIYVPAYASGGNYMFRNDGTGRFVGVNNLVTRTGGSAYAGPIGGNWADYDNDGRLDLCVISLKGGRTAVYRNLGNGEFESPSGAPNLPGHHNFASWADYDNDGFLDLFLSGAYGRNQLFRGQSDGTFTEVTTGSIVWDRPPGSATSYYSALWFDYDNDGFLDLYVMNLDDNRTLYTSQFLYHNNGNANGWLKVRLIGTASNRDAVGAKVRALASYAGAARWQRRDITGGEVFNGGHLYAHFGLGNATRVTTLRIEWPSGAVQELSNLTINQFLTIWEPPAVSATVRAGGACELTVKAEPNRGWQIKASSDLVDWQTLTTVTNATVTFQYTDTTAIGVPYRFYRVDERE